MGAKYVGVWVWKCVNMWVGVGVKLYVFELYISGERSAWVWECVSEWVCECVSVLVSGCEIVRIRIICYSGRMCRSRWEGMTKRNSGCCILGIVGVGRYKGGFTCGYERRWQWELVCKDEKASSITFPPFLILTSVQVNQISLTYISSIAFFPSLNETIFIWFPFSSNTVELENTLMFPYSSPFHPRLLRTQVIYLFLELRVFAMNTKLFFQ